MQNILKRLFARKAPEQRDAGAGTEQAGLLTPVRFSPNPVVSMGGGTIDPDDVLRLREAIIKASCARGGQSQVTNHVQELLGKMDSRTTYQRGTSWREAAASGENRSAAVKAASLN